MIPKIIHYCWFGGKPLTELGQKCIESWKKYCPDYEIMRWDETNIDIGSNIYMKEAFENKCWGFVPDVARLQIISKYGGIYLDTDVEIIRNIDDLLENKAFMGIEEGISKSYVALGLGFGAVPHNPIIDRLLSDYEDRHFVNEDGSLNKLPAPQIQTSTLLQMGFNGKNETQILQNGKIFSSEYFCPKSYITGELKITSNTYSIHQYESSWLSSWKKMKYKIRIFLIQRFGQENVEKSWAIIKNKRRYKQNESDFDAKNTGKNKKYRR